MTKELREICKCDICKKEVDRLIEVCLPYETYVDTTSSFISYHKSGKCSAKSLDICQNCAMGIFTRISEYVIIEDIPWQGYNIQLNKGVDNND